MNLEYITLCVYFIMLVTIGKVFSRFSRNLSDYVRGGAQGTWWLVGTSILMASISAFTFTGNASAAYEAGPTFLIMYAANVASFVIGALFLAAWFRQSRAYTVPDLLRIRFGKAVEQFFAYTSLLLNPLGAAIQLWALAIFAGTAFGFPLTPTIVGIGVIVIIYSTLGGKWAVMAADFVQGMIMLALTTLIGVLALIKIGGFGAFFSYFTAPEFAQDFTLVKEPGQFSGDRFTWHWIFVIFFMQLYTQVGLSSAQRYLSTKDGREARRAALLAAVLMAAGTIIWFIPPMVARFLYQDAMAAAGIPPESSYVFIARELLPNGMMGLMIAAMFSATMSSMDFGLNEQVGNLARNVIPRLRSAFGFKQELSDKQNLILCKLLTLIIGALIICYSLLFANNKELILFNAMLLIGSIVMIPLTLPTLMGLLFEKLPRWSYWAIFASTAIPSAYSLWDGHVTGVEWTIQTRAMWLFIWGTATTLICLLFSKYRSAQEKEEINSFFKLMRTPVDYAKEIGVTRDAEQLVLIGNTVIVLGMLILLFLIIPNTAGARLSIALVALGILGIGGLMRLGARAEKRRQLKLESIIQEQS